MHYFVMKIMTTLAEMKSCYSSLFTSRHLVGCNTRHISEFKRIISISLLTVAYM